MNQQVAWSVLFKKKQKNDTEKYSEEEKISLLFRSLKNYGKTNSRSEDAECIFFQKFPKVIARSNVYIKLSFVAFVLKLILLYSRFYLFN